LAAEKKYALVMALEEVVELNLEQKALEDLEPMQVCAPE
jgi:hypothetical protein